MLASWYHLYYVLVASPPPPGAIARIFSGGSACELAVFPYTAPRLSSGRSLETKQPGGAAELLPRKILSRVESSRWYLAVRTKLSSSKPTTIQCQLTLNEAVVSHSRHEYILRSVSKIYGLALIRAAVSRITPRSLKPG